MHTVSVRKEDVVRKWYIVDAEKQVVGRLASEVAKILRGKHKPLYTPHVDVRFDVVAITLLPGVPPEVIHVPAAFTPSSHFLY